MIHLETAIHHLPEPILDKLEAMISRVRRLLLVRGLFATLAVALGSLLAIMLIDLTVTLYSAPIRWALTLLGLVATLMTSWYYLIRPLSRKITLTRIARILEIRHPELQERISTAVELMSSDDPESIRGSEELISAVVDSAVADVGTVDPKLEFGAAKVSRFVKIAAAAVFLLSLLFLIWPNRAGALLVRAVAPFLNVGNAWADTLTVIPGNARVPIGDPVTIEMTVKHEKLRRAEIRRRLPGGSESVERMSLTEVDADGVKKFSVTFPAVSESFEYRIGAGPAVSEYYRIEAAPRPEVETLTLRYDFPEYTGRAPEEFSSDTGEIAALARSRVTVRAGLNKPATKGRLLINGEPIDTEGRIEGKTVTWDFELLPETEGLWQMRFEDEDGFENIPVDHSIAAIADRAPRVAVTSPPGRELRVRPSELVSFRYEIEEDCGLGEVELLVSPNGAPAPWVFRQLLPESDGTEGIWRGMAPLNLAALALEDYHHTLTVQLVARDNLPAAYRGPNEGASRKLTLVLDREAKSLTEQTMDAQREQIREALGKAREELSQAKNEVKKAERQLSKEDAVSQPTMENLDEFREGAHRAQEVLREVGEKMEDTVFRREAAEMQGVADEEISQAREAADRIPVTDEKTARSAQAKEASRQVDMALAGLKEIEKSLQRRGAEEQVLAQLNQLANEQRDLAARAGEQARMPSETPEIQQPTDEMRAQQMAEFQRRQEQIRSELAKMLAENPEALRDILKRQQDQASEMAGQAQRMTEQQEHLKELTQEAARGENQERVRQELVKRLQRAQEEIAEETRELQEEMNRQQAAAGGPMEQATRRTEEAAAALRQEQLEQGRAEAVEAGEALAEAGRQAEALAEESAGEETADSAEMPEETAGTSPSAAEKENGGIPPGSQRSPMASEGVREQLADLAERQRAVAAQLGAAQAGQFDEALADMEEALETQSEELRTRAEDLEDATAAVQQWKAKEGAASAEDSLKAAAAQTEEAREKLEQAQAAQDAAEQSGQAETGEVAEAARQALQESDGPQNRAQQSLSDAARALENTAAALGGSIEKLDPSAQPQMLDNQDLAESFEDVNESAQSRDSRQAAQRSQQAAQSLQQLAQSALEQMGGMTAQQSGQPQPAPQFVEDGNPQLNETGMKTADILGDGVPPELEALGISAADWARLKGSLRAGGASQGADDLPAEYRELVGRYFQVIAKEAGRKP